MSSYWSLDADKIITKIKTKGHKDKKYSLHWVWRPSFIFAKTW